jgi:hypothetical protein
MLKEGKKEREGDNAMQHNVTWNRHDQEETNDSREKGRN